MAAFHKIKVFVVDKIHIDGIKLLSRKFRVITKYGMTNDKLITFISGYTDSGSRNDVLVIRSTRKIDETNIKRIKQETSIKTICTVSSGFDNVDVSSARKHKIKVLNVPKGNYISAAEHTFALLLAITKKIREKHSEIESGKFNTQPGQTAEISGKTIGIVGVGRVGSYVARLAKSFGMRILGNDIKQSLKAKYKWIKFVSLNKLLENSDYVTLHTPLDKTTRDLIGVLNIKLLKKESILLNCARGGVVNEIALYKALKSNRISYAGLDVFENEPEINFEFSKLSNILLTPHIAGKTVESYRRMALMAAEIINNIF